jgi:PAS domain S-box-containing protein
MTPTTVSATRIKVSRPCTVPQWSTEGASHCAPPSSRRSGNSSKFMHGMVPNLVCIRDAQGRLSRVSRHIREFTGLSSAKLIETDGMSAVHSDDIARISSLLSQVSVLDEPFSYVFRHRRFDGTYRWFEAAAQPLMDSTGKVLRWSVTLADIDDRVKDRRSVATHSIEPDCVPTSVEAVASVIHEVSQPLSAAMANAHAAMRYLSSSSPDIAAARAALKSVMQDTRDATDTVREMRAFFQKDEPFSNPVDLLTIVGRARHLLVDELRRFAIDIKVQIERSLPVIFGHAHQLRQVLVNLMRNAIESMADNQAHPRELKVSARRDGHRILIQIADRGHGLPHPARIFEPFFTTKDSGMGMGLRVCQRIVEAHHGELWAEPRHPRGSIFSFTLPIAGAQQD